MRRPDLFVPSLVFPLVFLASFAGGLSALGSVPGFHFPAGYTAFQFVFVLCQSAMFAGLFTGFSLAFDFESGFARRLMLAAEDRRGIALGYALVALSRAAITFTLITAVALATGMRITGSGVDMFGLYGLAALLVLVGYCWAAGVAFRFRSIQAGPLMQTPVFLIIFLAPVYVPLALLKGWIHAVASVNPATAFLEAGRGLISGAHDHTALAYVCAVGLIVLFAAWMLTGCATPNGRPDSARAADRAQAFSRRARSAASGVLSTRRLSAPWSCTADRQTGPAAAHDEDFTQVDRAADIADPRQTQPCLQSAPHRLAERVLEELHLAHVRQRNRHVAHQPEHLLPAREANLEVLAAEHDAHGCTVAPPPQRPGRVRGLALARPGV